MKKLLVLLTVAGRCGLIAGSVLSPEKAGACGNEVMRHKASHQLVHKAEEALEQGRNRRAMLLLEDSYADDPAQSRRIARIVAVAEMRHLKSWNTDDPKSHTAPLKVLQYLLKGAPDDPYLLARVAEALSYKSCGDGAALQIVTDLATRDLMPDAEGWATLALLRGRMGDSLGQTEAGERCRKIARRPEVCATPAP